MNPLPKVLTDDEVRRVLSAAFRAERLRDVRIPERELNRGKIRTARPSPEDHPAKATSRSPELHPRHVRALRELAL
jgi:hypothetical protein